LQLPAWGVTYVQSQEGDVPYSVMIYIAKMDEVTSMSVLPLLLLLRTGTLPRGMYAPVMQFDKEHPGLMVYTPCGRPDASAR
jgi:hypothetical protein